MRLPRLGRWAAALLLAAVVPLAAVSCGKTKPASATGGSSGSGGGPGSGGAGGAGLLAPCLDRPDDLARPPTNGLPCELLPPNLTR